MIIGRSGSGKTASMRNLDPAKTGVVNPDLEMFPFPMAGYDTIMNGNAPDLMLSNYVKTVKPASVMATLNAWEQRPDIETIVLDTITHLLTNYYVNFCLGQPYSGYKELGTAFMDVMDWVGKSEKNVIIFGHVKKDFNDEGHLVTEMKSHGKMIKEFEPESYFNMLMYAEVIKDEQGIRHVFRCEADNPSESVKVPTSFANNVGTPIFDRYIDNDLQFVLDELDKFYTS